MTARVAYVESREECLGREGRAKGKGGGGEHSQGIQGGEGAARPVCSRKKSLREDEKRHDLRGCFLGREGPISF